MIVMNNLWDFDYHSIYTILSPRGIIIIIFFFCMCYDSNFFLYI